jgi:hypothetical protein
MKYILLIFTVAILSSCGDGSFINHTLEFRKTGDCIPGEKVVNMLSNIAGERYEFEACLDANFDGKNYNVERKGDSIIVSFPKTATAQSAFKITLDIDAKPEYHHIFLDGKEVIVGQQQLLDVK